MKFLPDPESIRKCLVNGLEASNSLDAAVAFVGRDWADIIGTFSGSVRIICWLSSPNTNPYAVEQMMQRDNICIRQLSAMHAKVYILNGPSPRSIVGSANLTGAALSEENASGQYESAVDISHKKMVKEIVHWFEKLWEEKTDSISANDLSSAKDVWKKARSASPGRGKNQGRRASSRAIGSSFPPRWKPKKGLIDLSNKVKDLDIISEFEVHHDVLARLVDRGSRKDVKNLISRLVDSTRRPGAHRPALEEGDERIKNAFETLFDRSRSVENRLSPSVA